ncbi:hypothetical protein PybrP1_009466 [[Pythium] brassicae (nom. inval.)]|nr:hypothetical protein PybrP1_009466 [[Pythium] brassicae (nom. inval.)]
MCQVERTHESGTHHTQFGLHHSKLMTATETAAMTAPETAIKSETADMDAGAPEVLPPTASDVALSSADADVPHPANADTHDAPAEPVAPSKRAARREKRRVIFEEKKERKKQQRKEQRATSQPAPKIDMSEDAVLRRRERTVAKRESYLMAAEEGVTVVIDCGFEDDMDSREKKSLSQQIMCAAVVWVVCVCVMTVGATATDSQRRFSYGVNRRSPKPVRYDGRLLSYVDELCALLVCVRVVLCRWMRPTYALAGAGLRCSSAYITSLSGETQENLTKISGFNEWLAFKATSKSYFELFKKESLVYLTADSPHTITHLSRDKVREGAVRSGARPVPSASWGWLLYPSRRAHFARRLQVYIIGGIVDRNRLKGITYKKAVEQGIETGKLPLDQVIDMGVATRVLTVNHGAATCVRFFRMRVCALARSLIPLALVCAVFEILTQYAQQEDWASAALATLPSRKNVQLKQEEEQ